MPRPSPKRRRPPPPSLPMLTQSAAGALASPQPYQRPVRAPGRARASLFYGEQVAQRGADLPPKARQALLAVRPRVGGRRRGARRRLGRRCRARRRRGGPPAPPGLVCAPPAPAPRPPPRAVAGESMSNPPAPPRRPPPANVGESPDARCCRIRRAADTDAQCTAASYAPAPCSVSSEPARTGSTYAERQAHRRRQRPLSSCLLDKLLATPPSA